MLADPNPLHAIAPVESILSAMRRLARSLARAAGLPALADDLTQLGLETACRLAGRYDRSRDAAFTTFVHPYARGVMLNAIARERRLRARARDLETDLDADLPDDAPTAEQILADTGEHRARVGIAHARLDRLNPIERRLVEACLMYGRSVEAVSAELGLSYKAGRIRLEKAKKKLRRAPPT